MDPIDHVALTRQLVDIESTTGNEGDVATFLATLLRDRGYSVLEQPLEPRQDTHPSPWPMAAKQCFPSRSKFLLEDTRHIIKKKTTPSLKNLLI